MSYSDYQSWRDTEVSGAPDVSVVIPAYDESDRIVPTIGSIAAHMCSRSLSWELIVSDDGSSDGTVDLVRSLGLCNVRILDPGANQGKGAAVRDGVLAARGRFVLFSDADMSTPIDEFDRLLDSVADGADVAIASRAAEGADEAGRSALRRLMSNTLRSMVRRATGVEAEDTQCGFKLFTRESAESLFGASIVDGFSFDLEVLWLAQRWGLRVAEIPVRWVDAPGSKVQPVRESLRFLIDVALLRIRAARRHYSVSPGAMAGAR